MMKVLLIVSGSIAIKKIPELLFLLDKEKINIDCIVTKSGISLTKSLKISFFKNCKVYTDKDFFNKNNMLHIELSRKADAIIVYPASANIIGKYSNGIADDFATSTLLASNKQVFIVPAMNKEMWINRANQMNVKKLKNSGVNFIGPVYGNLACGEIGIGRISDTRSVVDELCLYLRRKKILKGLTGLITSGPTIEPIDSTRYVSNYSSGKQGYAIAKILSLMGARIKLISGPTNLDKPSGVQIINVNSAKEMNKATMDLLPVDFAICVAAVSDFKPKRFVFNKRKKEEIKSINLTMNPDILYNISNSVKKRPLLVVGFSAETSNIKKNAKLKLINKKCDWILANKITKNNSIFGSEKNSICYITKNSYEKWSEMSKLEIAKKLNYKIVDFFKEHNEKSN
tara:strand:- start:2518 stop:3717 length:1200 start_codon:yes stop_codon:yes gene_type:complete